MLEKSANHSHSGKRSYQEQHQFNERIDETIKRVQAELEAVPSSSMTATAFERAREALDKGRKLIAERQKLIKIADRSELGLAGQWSMSTPQTSLQTIAVMRSGWKKPRRWLREKQPNRRSFWSTETSHIGSPLFSQRLPTRLLLRHRLWLDATH